MVRLYSKRLPFSGLRYHYERVSISKIEVYERVGNLSFKEYPSSGSKMLMGSSHLLPSAWRAFSNIVHKLFFPSI